MTECEAAMAAVWGTAFARRLAEVRAFYDRRLNVPQKNQAANLAGEEADEAVRLALLYLDAKPKGKKR